MSSRRLLGERVMVKVQGCPTRNGVLIAGVKKQTKLIQKFPVRFSNGDVRTYRGDQLLLRGSKAPLLEYIRVGDIVFTNKTLGVVRFIGLHEEYVGTIIVMEPIDPKLPTDPDVKSFRKLFPSANLSDRRSYNIIRAVEEILKILPPDALLQQLSKVKDKYLSFVEEARENDRVFEEDMSQRQKKITELENEIKEQENEIMNAADSESDGAVPRDKADEASDTQILFEPGKLGIKAIWHTGFIEGVSEGGQAEKLGVKVGWIILKIDDEEYSEELLDSKVAGSHEYALTFDTSTRTEENPEEVGTGSTLPNSNLLNRDVPLKQILTTESEREKYEREINYLSEQIEDFQYTVESLQEKNAKLEEDHKDMPKLGTKVEQLRNSRTMFMAQIKEVQKRGKEWKRKAEENEQKYKKLLEELQLSENASTNVPNLAKKNKHREAGKPGNSRRHLRKNSIPMPVPDSANTVSLGSQTAPQVGDGSSQSFSLSNLHKKDAAGNIPEKKNYKKNNSKKKPRMPWFN